MNLDLLKSMLRRFEGLRLHRYLDSEGKPTIGWGHLLVNDPREVVTPEEAEDLFEQDIDKALKRCQLFIPQWNLLNDVRQIVLACMVFQMGIGSPGRSGVLAFVDMITALRRQDFDGAAAAMLDSKWHRQTPKRAEELAEMMKTGDVPIAAPTEIVAPEPTLEAKV